MQKDLRKYAGTDYLQVLNNQIILPTSYFGPIPYYSILVNSDNYIFEKNENSLLVINFNNKITERTK